MTRAGRDLPFFSGYKFESPAFSQKYISHTFRHGPHQRKFRNNTNTMQAAYHPRVKKNAQSEGVDLISTRGSRYSPVEISTYLQNFHNGTSVMCKRIRPGIRFPVPSRLEKWGKYGLLDPMSALNGLFLAPAAGYSVRRQSIPGVRSFAQKAQHRGHGEKREHGEFFAVSTSEDARLSGRE